VSQIPVHVVFAEEDALFRLMEMALRRRPTQDGEKALHYFFGTDIAASRASLIGIADRLGLPEMTTSTCADEAALDRALPAAEIIVAESRKFDGARLQACASKVRLIQQFGRLYGNIDIAAAQRLGIPVANFERLTTLSCADHVAALILSLARNLPAANRAVQARRNPVLRPAFAIEPPRNKFNWVGLGGFRVLAQSTVGFIGLGEISGLAARRMRAFGARVLYYKRRRLTAEEERQYGGIEYAPLDVLLPQADFVSLHLPYHDGTEKFAGRALFAQMKRGAYLINAARGGLVDEQALYDSLVTGHLRGAALDTYRYEPVPAGCPLLALDNVLWSPHIAGGEPDYMLVETETVLVNIARVLRGEPPTGLIAMRQSE
jgi:phosphoglycerate dehydrogenase-like enzyme